VKQVIGVFFLLILLALGLALATDFRGIATQQARASQRSRARGSLFRGDQTYEAQQRRLTQATVINRVIGLVFALMSLSAVIAVIAKS
jgi:hypothetical protein